MSEFNVKLSREDCEIIRDAITTEYFHLKEDGDTASITALIKAEAKIINALREVGKYERY